MNVIRLDPRYLRIPGSRQEGADPGKLSRQISRFGNSLTEMPPIWVYRIQNGEYLIANGVTRATRAAKLRPGELVPVLVIGSLRVSPRRYATILEKLP